VGVITLDNLTKRYGRRVGVRDLSLTVPENCLFGFLGPNGAGKTTTIRVLLGFLRPTSGQASVFGLSCWERTAAIKADVGYLPGDLRLYPWLTCRSALEMFGAIRGCDLTTHGGELAELFGLETEVRVRSMSRGMRQKLGLILALAHRPRLLVLDEPTASLDPLMQERLYEHLRGLAARGHTIFFSSHTLSEVERLCERVAILRDGKLVADESLEALRARAGRVVTIRWKVSAAGAEPEPPAYLRVHTRRRGEWEATMTGSAAELTRWCASQPIEDVSIGQPDLRDLFRQYYSQVVV